MQSCWHAIEADECCDFAVTAGMEMLHGAEKKEKKCSGNLKSCIKGSRSPSSW